MGEAFGGVSRGPPPACPKPKINLSDKQRGLTLRRQALRRHEHIAVVTVAVLLLHLGLQGRAIRRRIVVLAGHSGWGCSSHN